jgi:hypothetical protein
MDIKCTTRALLEKIKQHLRYSASTGLLRWHYPNTRDGRQKRLHRQVAGSVATGYVLVGIHDPSTGKFHMLKGHHVCWFLRSGSWPTTPIDHRNRRKDDNRWVNLRPATKYIDRWNKNLASNNKSGVRGVSLFNGRYKAYIGCDRQQHYLGSYTDIRLAAHRRAEAEISYFGRRVPSSVGRQ